MIALGCPVRACPHRYPVSEDDPDSALTEMQDHLAGFHWMRPAAAAAALAQVREIEVPDADE